MAGSESNKIPLGPVSASAKRWIRFAACRRTRNFGRQGILQGLLTLARVLSCMEERLGVSVDVVQDPVPDDSLLVVSKVVPLYEGH